MNKQYDYDDLTTEIMDRESFYLCMGHLHAAKGHGYFEGCEKVQQPLDDVIKILGERFGVEQ